MLDCSKQHASSTALTAESETLEHMLQSIVNSLSKILKLQSVDAQTFHRFETIFERSSTIEQVVQAIAKMCDLAVRKMKPTGTHGSPNSSSLALDSLDPKPSHLPSPEPPSHKKSRKGDCQKSIGLRNRSQTNFDDSAVASTNAQLGSQNYDSLEKLLQKYEAEIRDHIRIEQQMKIYSDSLEENIAELEAKVRKAEAESTGFQGQCSELQRELISLKAEPRLAKSRQAHKINMVSDLSIGNSRHLRQISIDKVNWPDTQGTDMSVREPAGSLQQQSFADKSARHRKP